MANNLYIPSRQRIILCKETTSGVPVSTGGILGPVSNPQTQTSGTPTEEHADLGLGVDMFSVAPVARSATTQWSELLRADCLGMFNLMGLLGAGCDTIVGTGDPYTHTGAVVSALPPTYTLYHDTGLATEYLQIPYMTPSSVTISWSPTSPVTVATQMMGLLPTIVAAAPTIATRTIAKRAKSYDGVYTYQSSTAGTTYNARVVSGSLVFSRSSTPLVTADSASATDVTPGPLTMTGTLEMVYRGAGANTAYADWLLWKEQGTSTNKNSIVWTPSDSHSISISWWPMLFTSCDITMGSDNALHVNVQFTCANDLASANAASPVITAPSSVVLLNALSAAMA